MEVVRSGFWASGECYVEWHCGTVWGNEFGSILLSYAKADKRNVAGEGFPYINHIGTVKGHKYSSL